MRAVNERTVGTHLLNHIPQGLHNRGVNKGLRIVNKYHGILHGIEHGTQVVEHSFLTITKAQRRVFVALSLGREQQFTILAQNLILGEHILPHLNYLVELGLGEFHLLLHQLVSLEVHQATELINHHHVGKFVKLALSCVDNLLHVLIEFVKALTY